MSLFKTIKSERQKALGNNRVKYNLFGVIISEIQRKTSDDNVEDSLTIQIVKKVLESVNETLAVSKTAQPDLEEEKNLLINLLPKQLSSEELLIIMKELVDSDPSMAEKQNMFPYLKANYNGLYNGKDANILLTQLGL